MRPRMQPCRAGDRIRKEADALAYPTAKAGSALLLLMLGVFANDHHMTLALDDFALLANGLYRRTNFHFAFPP